MIKKEDVEFAKLMANLDFRTQEFYILCKKLKKLTQEDFAAQHEELLALKQKFEINNLAIRQLSQKLKMISKYSRRNQEENEQKQ